MSILLIGNGLSRKDINIKDIVNRFNILHTIGCNGIWKDYMPHNIVMWDSEPIIKYCEHIKGKEEYERQNWINRLIIPDKFDKAEVSVAAGRNSGAYAMLWAVKNLTPRKFFILGYDYFINTYDRGKNLYSYNNEQPFTLDDGHASNRACDMSFFMKKHSEIEFNIFTHDGIDLDPLIRGIPNIRKMPFKPGLPKVENVNIKMVEDPQTRNII